MEAAQCRAARALLDWTQSDLSGRSGLSVVSIRAFEKGGEMRDSNRKLLRLVFERSGVEFIPENGVGQVCAFEQRQRNAPCLLVSSQTS